MPLRKSLEPKAKNTLHDRNSNRSHELSALRILGPAFALRKSQKKIRGARSDRNQASHHASHRRRKCFTKMRLQWKRTKPQRQEVDEVCTGTEENGGDRPRRRRTRTHGRTLEIWNTNRIPDPFHNAPRACWSQELYEAANRKERPGLCKQTSARAVCWI